MISGRERKRAKIAATAGTSPSKAAQSSAIRGDEGRSVFVAAHRGLERTLGGRGTEPLPSEVLADEQVDLVSGRGPFAYPGASA